MALEIDSNMAEPHLLLARMAQAGGVEKQATISYRTYRQLGGTDPL